MMIGCELEQDPEVCPRCSSELRFLKDVEDVYCCRICGFAPDDQDTAAATYAEQKASEEEDRYS